MKTSLTIEESTQAMREMALTHAQKNRWEDHMDKFMQMLAECYGYLGVPLIFVAVVFWIYRPSARKRYEADAKIPFTEDQDKGAGNPGRRGR